MTSQTKLWALSAGALALSLALAGCGSSGGSGTAAVSPSQPPSQDTDNGQPPPPGISDQDEPRGVAALFVAAQTARDDATNAAKAADDAVKDATKYSRMLDTAGAEGDSAMAMANAQKVLDAKAAAEKAVEDAEAALTSAKDAKTEAEALPADDPSRASLIVALDAAIEDAEEMVTAAKEQAEEMPLKDAIAKVQNPAESEMAPDPLKTPQDAADAVAMAIGMVIGPDGTIAHVNVPETPDMATDVIPEMPSDTKGMTWEMIVGSDKVMDMRIGATGGGTMAVRAASFADMPLSAITASAPAVGATIADGTQYGEANYKGIGGTVFCAGSDCKVEGEQDSEMLTGSWYFAPDDAKDTYVADDESYTEETDYASYGYWFQVDAESGAVTFNTFAAKGEGTETQNGDFATAANADLAGTAEYAGSAIGMSVYKTFSAGKQTSIASGEFTAAVGLTATFGDGADAGVKGTVDGFMGPAVDTGWSVDLERAEFGTNGEANGVGVADGGGGAGAWSNGTYGPTDERPVGIFGTFNAHFSNGHAAGAYATRK